MSDTMIKTIIFSTAVIGGSMFGAAQLSSSNDTAFAAGDPERVARANTGQTSDSIFFDGGAGAKDTLRVAAIIEPTSAQVAAPVDDIRRVVPVTLSSPDIIAPTVSSAVQKTAPWVVGAQLPAAADGATADQGTATQSAATQGTVSGDPGP